MTDQRRATGHGHDGAARPSRRDLLRSGAAAAVAAGVLRLRYPAPAGAQSAATAAADVCVLTPELTEGPYYLPLDLLREDVTEGTPGLPLQLRVNVVDLANGCAPLPKAAVDIWHCDAQGYYSGVAANPGGGASGGPKVDSGTFLRGVQETGDDGGAEFLTIYPGWYTGRTVHIHLKVHVGGRDGESTSATGTPEAVYEGGHVAHTGQIFFDDAISDDVYGQAAAYGGRDNSRRTTNAQDNILGGHLDEPGFLVALEPLAGDPLASGFRGVVTIGVDSATTPGAAGFGGPGGPPPGGPGGTPPANG